MAFEEIENQTVLPSEFQQAADPSAPVIQPEKVMVPLPIDADVLAYFQSETEPSNWKEHMNGVLRFYVETNRMREYDMEIMAHTDPAQPQP